MKKWDIRALLSMGMIFVLVSIGFCDSLPVYFKNGIELKYLYSDRHGCGVSYLHFFHRRFAVNGYFHFRYRTSGGTPEPDVVSIYPENYNLTLGIGLQQKWISFGRWNFSCLYSIEEGFHYSHWIRTGPAYNPAYDYGYIFPVPEDSYSYTTMICLMPKLEVHFMRRIFLNLSLGPSFGIGYSSSGAINKSYDAELILGGGINF